ncbi:MAG: Ig-like domain-containing protein [Bradymonadales bacterium]|nr:Ig-like domain-containing protein [Bradymonadales bacterium]
MLNTSHRFPFSGILFALSALVFTLFLPIGCGDDEEGCVNSDECPSDQACVGGACIDRSLGRCDTRDDCDRGQICEGGYCVDEGSDAGDVGPDAGDAGQDPVPDAVTEPDMAPDVPIDRPADQNFENPPQVVSTEPAAYATGVPINATVSITFDQPMVSTSISPNLRIQDYGGTSLARAIAYNPDTWTASLTPTAPQHYFAYAAPYTVVVEEYISGQNGLYMTDDYRFTFATANYSNLEGYAALALAYAPVVYAEVRPGTATVPTHRVDWFTKVDFDSNMRADDNLANATPANRQITPHVYYNVLETTTHYFIQYIFYYPVAVNDRNHTAAQAVEHDFSLSVVVVQKLDSDPLGRFVMAEGLGDSQVWGFALSSYPTDCGGEEQPVCGGITDPSDDMFVRFSSDLLEPADDFPDSPGRRYPMYLATGGHASCLAPAWEPIGIGWRTPNLCAHNTGEGAPFYSDNADWSRILRAGEGTRWTIAQETETNELTYSISSFLDAFWVRRGDDRLFSGRRIYTPPPESGSTANAIHPTWLTTTGSGSEYRHPPFLAEADVRRTCGGCSHVGVWFTDPAWEIAGHADFDHDYTNTYCFNPFLGIDLRDTEECE